MRILKAKFHGFCRKCAKRIRPGCLIVWRGVKESFHLQCVLRQLSAGRSRVSSGPTSTQKDKDLEARLQACERAGFR